MYKRFLILASLVALVGFSVKAQQLTHSDSTSFSANGISINANDSYTTQLIGTNANYGSLTITNGGDVSLLLSPVISNGVLRVKNTSSTNTPNYVKYGSESAGGPTNYVNLVFPQEVGYARMLLGNDNAAHFATSNGIQTISWLWTPQP